MSKIAHERLLTNFGRKQIGDKCHAVLKVWASLQLGEMTLGQTLHNNLRHRNGLPRWFGYQVSSILRILSLIILTFKHRGEIGPMPTVPLTVSS